MDCLSEKQAQMFPNLGYGDQRLGIFLEAAKRKYKELFDPDFDIQCVFKWADSLVEVHWLEVGRRLSMVKAHPVGPLPFNDPPFIRDYTEDQKKHIEALGYQSISKQMPLGVERTESVIKQASQGVNDRADGVMKRPSAASSEQSPMKRPSAASSSRVPAKVLKRPSSGA